MQTCLQMLQTVYRRIGLNVAPVTAVTSSDLGVLQVLSFIEEEGQEQATRYAWQALQFESTFTTVATQVQTSIATLGGFDYIINDTIWNRTLRRPVYGPKTRQDWQQAKAMQINGPFNSFRIMQGSINFYPTPPAGQACYFEYQSRNWISLVAGGTGLAFASDLDTPLLDDQLIILGATWRWKQSKGLDFEGDKTTYERRMIDAMGRDAGKPTLSMDGSAYDIQPVVLVPRGSWGV